MKNTKLFQYVVMGAFIFFIIIGAILFSVYKSKNSTNTNITVTVWGTLPTETFSAFYLKYFSENNLDYNINYVERDTATFEQELVEALASETGPDAIILSTDQIVRFNNKIYTIPYTVLPELTFKESFIEEGSLFLNRNGVVAIPWMVDPLVMYWNRDIFNNVSVSKPPANWADVTALVPKMTVKDKSLNILKSTVALGEFRNVINAKDILSALIIQAGGSIINLDSNGSPYSTLIQDYGLESTPASVALGFFTNFSNPNKREYSWNRSLPNSLDAFTNGDLALYFGFASEFMTIKNKNPNLNFEVTILPQIAKTNIRSTFGNVYALAIMKKSPNPADTYTVISSLTSASAFPYWKDIFNLPSARRDILSQVEPSAAKTIFNRSALISKGWFDPNKAETSKIFQDMVESFTTGRDNLSGAISTASERLDSLLK